MCREAATRAVPKWISGTQNGNSPAAAVEHWLHRKWNWPDASAVTHSGQLEVARAAKYDFRLRQRIPT
jgi:hypothetical protein